MPANKNAVTRYYILDELLAQRHKEYSIVDLLSLVNQRLAEMDIPPVSRRTIEYDINYIEKEGPFLVEIERFQIDVPCQKNLSRPPVKKTCLRYADPSASIFTRPLTDDEKHLLGETFTLLGQFDGLPELKGLEKLRAGLDIKSDRQIISFTKNPLENSNLLGEFFTAIARKQVIEIHYHKFAAPDEDRHTVVIPYLLKEYNRRWHLIAAAEDTGKILNFALDRIDSVVPLPGHQYVEYKGDLNERFEDIIGVTLNEGNELQTIVFWVSDRSCEYVKTKPLHESQHDIKGEREAALRDKFPMLEGGRFFYIECIENYELLRELTSFGEELIVLSPEDIKQKVIDKINGMCSKYDLIGK